MAPLRTTNIKTEYKHGGSSSTMLGKRKFEPSGYSTPCLVKRLQYHPAARPVSPSNVVTLCSPDNNKPRLAHPRTLSGRRKRPSTVGSAPRPPTAVVVTTSEDDDVVYIRSSAHKADDSARPSARDALPVCEGRRTPEGKPEPRTLSVDAALELAGQYRMMYAGPCTDQLEARYRQWRCKLRTPVCKTTADCVGKGSVSSMTKNALCVSSWTRIRNVRLACGLIIERALIRHTMNTAAQVMSLYVLFAGNGFGQVPRRSMCNTYPMINKSG